MTYSIYSNFEQLGKFHHRRLGDGGETIPLKNTCKNKVSPPPPGDGGETLPALAGNTGINKIKLNNLQSPPQCYMLL